MIRNKAKNKFLIGETKLMEVREAASAASLNASIAGSANRDKYPQIAVYYFGDAFSSPFDLSQMSLSMTENGVL